ncbi:8609_t:CDS:2 [Funneliformis caledonium]|uniref:8609_t:CDS:1 n=1 Tax=Funneliformis caledonium TaxID=1117310 RepID=A0A9N9ARN3_9GLOM|nr:8609_t:CDS:2 [Funneliformis caledonium]
MDWMLLKLTCGFICVDEETNENSPFGSNYMLATSGFMITLAFCVPLTFLDLVDNIKVNVLANYIVSISQILCLFSAMTKDYIPLVSNDQSQVVGTVLFNYAFITTIPSWVNDLRPDVCIRKSIWYSVVISTASYSALGILGGMAYQMGLASNIIAQINASSHLSQLLYSGCGFINDQKRKGQHYIIEIVHREKGLESTPKKENKTKQSNEFLVNSAIVTPSSPKLKVSGTPIGTINEKTSSNVDVVDKDQNRPSRAINLEKARQILDMHILKKLTLIHDIDEIYLNKPSKNSFVAFPIQRKRE